VGGLDEAISAWGGAGPFWVVLAVALVLGARCARGL